MLTEDLGPYDVFERLRDYTVKWKFLNLDCFYCISVVASLVIWAVGSIGFYEAIAMAGVAIFINCLHERIS